MKKLFALILILAALAASVVGCASNKATIPLPTFDTEDADPKRPEVPKSPDAGMRRPATVSSVVQPPPAWRTNTVRFRYAPGMDSAKCIWAVRASTNGGKTKRVVWLHGMALDAEGFAVVTNQGQFTTFDAVGTLR